MCTATILSISMVGSYWGGNEFREMTSKVTLPFSLEPGCIIKTFCDQALLLLPTNLCGD